MSGDLYLGCDVGGTASCAVLVNTEANVVSSKQGGPGNPHVLGFEQSAQVVTNLMRVVLGNRTSQLCAVTVCISGGESETVRERYAEYFRDFLSLPRTVRVIVLHDVLAPLGLILPTAIQSSHGRETHSASQFAALIAGTGSVAASFTVSDGRPRNGGLQGDAFSIEMRRKCGGWGPILGDTGSGFAVVARALSLSLRIMDGMEESIQPSSSKSPVDDDATHLCDQGEARSLALSVLNAAIKHYHIEPLEGARRDFETQVNSLVKFLHDKETRRGHIASFSAQLASLAANGNGLCNHLFREAGEELGKHLVTALSLTPKNACAGDVSKTTVCCIGGVFKAWDSVPAFAHSFKNTIKHLLSEGGQVFLLKDKTNTGGSGDAERHAMAFSCAHLGALTLSQSNEHWQMQTSSHLNLLQ